MEQPITIEERDAYFILKNNDFIINLDKAGNILSWQIRNKGITIISTHSFKDIIYEEPLLNEPFVNYTSSSVIYEKDFKKGQLKKVFNIREKTLIVDIYFYTITSSIITYEFSLKFNNFIDYLMISKSKNKFTLNNPIHTKTIDFMLANEKQNIYFGCIFKEKANFLAEKKENIINISLKSTFSLTHNDFFMLSYTFALV